MESQTKLPLKSINGRRCLTKCYPKGEISVHPVFLTGITLETQNYCSIDPVYINDPILKESAEREFNMIFVDACKLEDNKIYQPPNELESILLSFYFNARDFLSNMYAIKSFKEAILWTNDNYYLPFDTIKRVHNCAWKAFGNNIESLTNMVIDYYYKLATEKWLYDYIQIIQNKYSFDFITNTEPKSNEIYDIILQKYFSENFFTKTVKNYVYENANNWDDINSHYGELKNYVFTQLINEIEIHSNK